MYLAVLYLKLASVRSIILEIGWWVPYFRVSKSKGAL